MSCWLAVETAKRIFLVGEDTLSGMVFADDFVGVSETPSQVSRIHYNILESESDSEG